MVIYGHIWRMLMDPDWSFQGFGRLSYQILHPESTFYVILELHKDVQLPNTIRSASSIRSYLEDIDGS